jgi:HEAT repeat protein
VALLRSRPPRVQKLTAKGDVEGLIRALAYEDAVKDREGRLLDLGARTRHQAVEALAAQSGNRATQGLAVALDDPDHGVRRAAIAALRERGADAEAPLARAAIAWTDREFAGIRAAAVAALAAVSDANTSRRTAHALLERPTKLTDQDGALLREVADAGGPEALGTTVADLVARLEDSADAERARLLLAALAPESVDPLVAALGNARICVEAALALGAIRDSRATEPLCHAVLASDSRELRAAGAWALGEIRDPSAVETLLVASGDDDYAARAAALDAFDKLGNAAVAVATTLLVRPGIENGSAPARITDVPPITQVPQPPTISARARPVLRRLLGRPDSEAPEQPG